MWKPARRGTPVIRYFIHHGFTYKILIINESSVGKYLSLMDTTKAFHLYVLFVRKYPK